MKEGKKKKKKEKKKKNNNDDKLPILFFVVGEVHVSIRLLESVIHTRSEVHGSEKHFDFIRRTRRSVPCSARGTLHLRTQLGLGISLAHCLKLANAHSELTVKNSKALERERERESFC